MYYLFTVGFSLSGKTWLVNKIKERYPKRFETVETRSIHDFLNTMEAFKDDNTISGGSYGLRQEATFEIRKGLISLFAKNGINIIQDSCNQVNKDRQERLDLVKSVIKDVKTVLIFVNTGINVIEKRADDEDRKLIGQGKPAAWRDLIEKQKERMEIPSKDEVDLFIEYDGSNWGEVLKKLDKIL